MFIDSLVEFIDSLEDILIAAVTSMQGFMQDNIIGSHTCFYGHMDVNC